MTGVRPSEFGMRAALLRHGLGRENRDTGLCADRFGVGIGQPRRKPVALTGQDGSAFAVLGRCREAAGAAGLSDDGIATLMGESMPGDFDRLLQTAMRWLGIDSVPRRGVGAPTLGEVRA